MAIATSSLAASYFVLDVPDVRWSNAAAGKTVRVTITPSNGAGVDLYETYTPDSNGVVTLRGLAELIQPYVKPCPTPLRQNLVTLHGVWLATVSKASFTAQLLNGSNTTISPTFHSYAFYSSRRTQATPGATAIWLTRYTERTILPVQPIALSVLLMQDLTARFVVEGTAAGGTTIQTATVNIPLTSASGTNANDESYSSVSGAASGTAPTYAAVIHYTVADLALAAGIAVPLRVTAELLRSGTVVDSVTYHIDRTHHAQRRVVAFTNCFGMLETEAFTGTDDEKTELDAEFGWVDRDYEKISTREVTQHRLATQFTDDVRARSLADIAASPEVFLIHADGTDCWEKMTVTAFDLTHNRPRTAPQTAYLTLRPSAMHQEEVQRTGDTDPGQARHRIFDYTHDYTFN